MKKDELDLVLQEMELELEKKGIDRRTALKIMALSSTAFLANPANAATSARANGKGVSIVIAGGGAAGCTIANFITKKIDNAKVTIIEPDSKSISYQPGQTLIGAGIWDKDDITRDSKDFFPSDAKWIQDRVVEFNPDSNNVRTSSNGVIEYDYLILATGLSLNYEAIDGLSKDDIGKNGIGSIYFADGAVKTWTLIQKLMEDAKSKKDLQAIYTQPNTPIKCGGAPKKIMFLTHALLRDAKLRDSVKLDFYPAGGGFFGVKEYNEATIGYFKDRDLNAHFHNNLIAIDPGYKKATFESKNGDTFDLEYDFIHVPPPMSAPEAVKNSPLSIKDGKLASGGWADVSKDTLVHNRYKNVFALGDVAGIPTSKSGAAIRDQYKVCGKNLISAIEGKELKEIYDGYTACPLITDIGKVMMAEFNYKKEPSPTLPILDPAKERWLWWFVKVYMLKPMYFHGMLKARA